MKKIEELTDKQKFVYHKFIKRSIFSSRHLVKFLLLNDFVCIMNNPNFFEDDFFYLTQDNIFSFYDKNFFKIMKAKKHFTKVLGNKLSDIKNIYYSERGNGFSFYINFDNGFGKKNIRYSDHNLNSWNQLPQYNIGNFIIF